VVFLHRDGFGPLELKGVSYGSWRLLDEGEIASLEKIIQDRKRQ
jgi:16S rRNA U516 pseudouridylate synthase RsuA-like enzyme